MLNQVINQIKNRQLSHFTGHLKFGIENNSIMSITVTNRIDNTVLGNVSNYEEPLKELAKEYPCFFGSLDFNLSFGTVTSFVYSTTIKGEELKATLSESEKCRSVKIVVKK